MIIKFLHWVYRFLHTRVKFWRLCWLLFFIRLQSFTITIIFVWETDLIYSFPLVPVAHLVWIQPKLFKTIRFDWLGLQSELCLPGPGTAFLHWEETLLHSQGVWSLCIDVLLGVVVPHKASEISAEWHLNTLKMLYE